jgi:hypothetical protein
MSDFKIILLYTSIDDEPVGDKKIRWITELSNLVSILINKLLGKPVEVIKLSEYEIEPDTFQYSPAVILPILSKNFFKSPLLSGYLEVIFNEINRKTKSKNNSTFYLLLKNKIMANEIPTSLSHSKSYYFFKTDAVTDYITEYKPDNPDDTENIYWLKVYDIVYEIKKFILSSESSVDQAQDLVSHMSLKSVYLAQVGLDLENQRESVKRELIRNGYNVYPETHLAENYSPLEMQVKESLNHCSISVHLVGEDSGKLIRDRGLSIVEIENQLSSEHCARINENEEIKKRNRFHRIIWLSDKMETLSVKQKLFIENLKREFANVKNTDILTLPVEELKSYIIHMLDQSLLYDKDNFVKKDRNRKMIYIICDADEYESCKPIGSFLQDYGFDVIFSNFEGEFLKIRDIHHRNLLNCDGTIIYYGDNDSNWVKSKLLDRMKAMGLGRENAKNPTAIVVNDEKKLNDTLTIEKDALILIKQGDITKESIQPFISRVEES